MSKIVVAGATGFIGKVLVGSLVADGHVVVGLSREGRAVGLATAGQWDGRSPDGLVPFLSDADAVINFVGAPINQRWTESARREIIDSRVNSTKAIGEAISRLDRPTPVWINGSATGFYGDTGDRAVDESSPPGTGFLPEICVAWEHACTDFALPSTRRVLLRTGVVLGQGGGALKPLAGLAKAFLGGAVGSGRQYVPWIHIDDEIELIKWALDSSVSGPVNAVALSSATQADLMKAIRTALHRPWAPPAPGFAVKLVGLVTGLPPSLALDSTRVVPKVAREAGFAWRHGELYEAVRSALGS